MPGDVAGEVRRRDGGIKDGSYVAIVRFGCWIIMKFYMRLHGFDYVGSSSSYEGDGSWKC